MDYDIDETNVNEENIDYSKFEELFFENVRKGEKVYDFIENTWI